MMNTLSTGIRELAANFYTKPRCEAEKDQAAETGRSKSKERSLAEAKIEAAAAGLGPAKAFRQLLCQERKRSERSRKCFLLMLVRAKSAPAAGGSALERAPGLLAGVIPETDILGWFETGVSAGVIFNELGSANLSAAL